VATENVTSGGPGEPGHDERARTWRRTKPEEGSDSRAGLTADSRERIEPVEQGLEAEARGRGYRLAGKRRRDNGKGAKPGDELGLLRDGRNP